MSTSLNELADLLGVPTARLQALTSCDDAELDVLATAVRTRMEADSAAVDAGFTDALGFVPRPLRGTARKVLFPRGSHD